MNSEEIMSVLKKIGKGALITGTGTAALYILAGLGKLDLGDLMTPIIALIIPVIVNAIREYMKGVELAGKRMAAEKKL